MYAAVPPDVRKGSAFSDTFANSAELYLGVAQSHFLPRRKAEGLPRIGRQSRTSVV